MSHLLAPQDEKKNTRSEPAVDDASFLVSPQEETSGQPSNTSAHSWLIPPQEEKIDVAALRGEQGKLDQAIGRLEQKIKQGRVEQFGGEDPDKQQRDSVISGAAGITGEDLGIAENHRILRS